MPNYITAITFLQQEILNAPKSSSRASVFTAAARKAGIKVSQVHWDPGEADGAIVFEARDDASAAMLMRSIAALGDVHPDTLRPIYAVEYSEIVPKLRRRRAMRFIDGFGAHHKNPAPSAR